MVKKFSVLIVLFLFAIISSNLFAVNEPGVSIYKNSEASVGMIRVDFKITYGEQSQMVAMGGTGWFFDKDHPYLLTNYHVVDVPDVIKYDTFFGPIDLIVTDRKYTFTDHKGKVYDCHVVATCPKLDMAIVKVDIDEWKALKLGDPNKLVVGEKVYAIGSPYGLLNSYSEGIVTYIDRRLEDAPDVINWIQHSAPTNPGNSGGPLFNSDGEVVGINTLRFDGGIYCSIPIDLFRFPWFWTIVDKDEFPGLE